VNYRHENEDSSIEQSLSPAFLSCSTPLNAFQTKVRCAQSSFVKFDNPVHEFVPHETRVQPAWQTRTNWCFVNVELFTFESFAGNNDRFIQPVHLSSLRGIPL
jgi:hypothetical protein